MRSRYVPGRSTWASTTTSASHPRWTSSPTFTSRTPPSGAAYLDHQGEHSTPGGGLLAARRHRAPFSVFRSPADAHREGGHYHPGTRRSPKQPFILYFALSAPHTPWVPVEPFLGRSKAGMYGDFAAQVNDTFGRGGVWNPKPPCGSSGMHHRSRRTCHCRCWFTKNPTGSCRRGLPPRLRCSIVSGWACNNAAPGAHGVGHGVLCRGAITSCSTGSHTRCQCCHRDACGGSTREMNAGE
jgi:hypothetical protein